MGFGDTDLWESTLGENAVEQSAHAHQKVSVQGVGHAHE